LSRAVGEETFPSYGSARIAHTSVTLLLTTVMSALPSGSNSKTIGPWINSSEPGPEKSVVPFVKRPATLVIRFKARLTREVDIERLTVPGCGRQV
jgi:hypothetical protein